MRDQWRQMIQGMPLDHKVVDVILPTDTLAEVMQSERFKADLEAMVERVADLVGMEFIRYPTGEYVREIARSAILGSDGGGL